MRFLDPWYALLFIPVVAGLILSWKQVHGLTKARKAVSFVVRAALASLIVFALMGPQSVRPNIGTATLFVLDRSDSISEADKKRALEFVDSAIASMGPDDVSGIVVFGAQPVVESAPGGKRPVRRILASINGSASNLASAVRVASASFPDGKARRIVILTDGNETVGEAIEAVEVASSDGITVDTVTLGTTNEKPEATVLDVQTPSERSTDEPFDLRIVVESTRAQEGTLVVERDGNVVSRTKVKMPEGRTAFLIEDTLGSAGFYRYRAYLEAPYDTDNRNNLGAGFVTVKGKPRILLVQGDPSKRELADALRTQGLDVDLRGAGGMPSRPDDVQPYDAVLLNDFNAAMTTERQMALLRAAVRDTGVGFAMVGGEDSFLPGGWYGTPVAEMLPVDLNVRQRQSFPSTSVLIVMDTSGSMGMVEDGVEKLKLAVNAAVQTARLLTAKDRFGVASSSDRIDYVAPMAELTNRDTIVSQIRKMRVNGGGIYVEPSVKFASEKLGAENTKVRHFILLADGADADMHGESLAIATKMRQQKITTSVVAIGDGMYVPFLKSLAAIGGGNFYLADKASKLPAIFTQDVALMSRSAIEEGAFLPKLVSGDEILQGISQTPPLLAYCLTDSRPIARTIMRTQKDDPLLATWQFGLGTSLAFTSDAQNRWAEAWVGWDGFSRFWAQAVRSLSRKATLNDYDISVEQDGAMGRLVVTAKDAGGTLINDPNLSVRVSAPDGSAQDVSLVQTSPGEFSGTFGASQIGSYIATIAEPTGQGTTRVATDGFSVTYPPEYRQFRANTGLMERVRQTANGAELTNPADIARPLADPGESVRDLWQYLVLAAMVLLPLDVGIRRVLIPFGALFGSKSAKPVARPMESLKAAKARATKPRRTPASKPERKRSDTREPEKPAAARKQDPVKQTWDIDLPDDVGQTPADSPTKAPADQEAASAGSKLLAARRQKAERRRRP